MSTWQAFTNYFNPRSHEGSDTSQSSQKGGENIFQSTLPRGERLLVDVTCTKIQKFQSTLPRGERRNVYGITAESPNFNPRSHEGSDHPVPFPNRVTCQFQSTLPRGERQLFSSFSTSVNDFNPRSHEGSDGRFDGSPAIIKDFNPRSHEGSDYIDNI